MATGLGIALHTAGLPVGPDRCERLARAVTVMGATSLADLRTCAAPPGPLTARPSGLTPHAPGAICPQESRICRFRNRFNAPSIRWEAARCSIDPVTLLAPAP
jgi:hypothetical protein